RLLDEFVDRAVEASEERYIQKGKSQEGQRPYGARTMLKLYLYGYFNRISSSRRLAKETLRNIEVIWLLNQLQPDFKTIADYRRDNGEAIRTLLKQFQKFLVANRYIDVKKISVDSVRLKANTNRNATSLKKIEGRLRQIDKQMTQYINALDLNDKKELKLEELGELELQKQAAMDKIAQLNEEIEDLLKKKKR
ncbi:MAG: transposase, partial [Bacteroidota bacterium]